MFRQTNQPAKPSQSGGMSPFTGDMGRFDGAGVYGGTQRPVGIQLWTDIQVSAPAIEKPVEVPD